MYQCNQKIIKNKVGLLNLAEELGNVSQACKIMGFSRDTFYRYKEAVNDGGVEALFDKSRRQSNLKNRTDEATESATIAFAIEFPAYGQLRASNELRKKGIFVSPSGVRCIWLRNNLESFKKRLLALEQKAAAEGLVLTDRGTEFFGKIEHHDYELFLAVNDIEHTKTKAASPQTNGICERFHKTILQEFYQVAFRKKIYHSLDELQKDLDDWLYFYNHQRTHQGKMCCGRTPMETFLDGKRIW